MRFFCVGHIGSLHFEQGHQERKRRFRSLIFVYAVGMKAVAASARGYVVKRNLQIVLAQEPPEDTLSFIEPASSCVSL